MTRASLTELRRRYLTEGQPLPAEVEAALRSDDRAGARAILAAIERRRAADRAEGQRLSRMLRFEQRLWDAGIRRIAGVDEAGMSPLAGPVTAAAAILPVGCRLRGVDDSKKLDPRTRERLALEIRDAAIAWAVAFVEPEEIDRLNIYWAGIEAMRRAVAALSPAPEHLLLDARHIPGLPLPQQGIVKGDQKSLSIAAASILAKTARDARMRELDAAYPGYGFARHKGYPVQEHVEALERLGPSPVHRRSFEPVRRLLGMEPAQRDLFSPGRSSRPPRR